MILQLIVALAGVYLLVIGIVTLFFPQQLNELLGYTTPPSTLAWMLMIGPMAIPMGTNLLNAIRDLERNIALIQAMLVLCISQVPLDVFLITSKRFRFSQIGFDLVLLAFFSLAVIALYPHRTDLIRIRQLRPERLCGTEIKLLRFSLGLLFFYLLLGWICAVFLPQLMCDLLGYSISVTGLPWVQYTGPLALALGAAFALAIDDPIRNKLIIQAGIEGAILELLLDATYIWRGTFKLYALSIDIPISAFFLVVLLLAHPKLSGEKSTLNSPPKRLKETEMKLISLEVKRL